MASYTKFSSDSPDDSQRDANIDDDNFPVDKLDGIDTENIIGDFESGDTNDSGFSRIDDVLDDEGADTVMLQPQYDADADDTDDDMSDEEQYPYWDDSYNSDFDDDSVYGDPDNVALDSEDDVFNNGEGLPSYAPGGGIPSFGDTTAQDDDEDSGFSSLFWWLVGLGTFLALALATWGALWMSTGEINPVKAVQGTTSEQTTPDNASSPIQSINEEDPNATTDEGDAQRISELESSLTVALDDAQQARDENARLQSSVSNRPNAQTSTRTVTSSGSNVTKTNTRTVKDTATTTQVRRETNTVTNTSTVRMAPTTVTRTITRPSTVRVPGPERTVTKTVPTGRATVTTTVVERWG